MSDEFIILSVTSDNSLASTLSFIGNKIRVKLDEGCLKQDKTTLTHEKTVNIYIFYEINLCNYVDSSDPTLGSSLFRAIKLVKNNDIDKYKFSGYSIELSHHLLVYLIKIKWILELTWILLYILITRKNIS